MKKIIIVLFVLFVTVNAQATTWGETTVTDPLTNAQISCQKPMSSGGYIYYWPSKYDLVFWPYTEENWICLNPDSGYAAFYNDFEKIAEKDKKRLTKWLNENFKPSQAPQSYEQKLLWLEKVYQQRSMDDDFWCYFYRLMAYFYRENQTQSLFYVKKALPLLHANLDTNPTGIKRIENLFLLGEYHRRLDESEKAKFYFSQVKKAKYKDEEGNEQTGHPYFLDLIKDRIN